MCAGTPLICSKSVLPEVFLAKLRNNLRFLLRVPLWFFVSFVFSPKHSTLSYRLYWSRACRAFRSLWPWKVCGFAAARSVFCSLGAALPPLLLY